MKRILIVDDEESLARTIALFLGDAGYRTAIAADGELAARALEREAPDLIISDLIMPNRDGLQLLEYVRDRRSLDNTKFMLMTVKDSVFEPLKRYALRSDAALAKPFTRDELLASVRNLIG
ncbi:MAG: response regulator [Candidatus Edwardsbacteria bacterium]|nr:response regulator [Candidatus Edwardsbacteria bacterium]